MKKLLFILFFVLLPVASFADLTDVVVEQQNEIAQLQAEIKLLKKAIQSIKLRCSDCEGYSMDVIRADGSREEYIK
jgi:hypothetical protein